MKRFMASLMLAPVMALSLAACDLPRADDSPAVIEVPEDETKPEAAPKPLLCVKDIREAWTVAPDAKGETSLGDTSVYAYTDGPFEVGVDETANLIFGIGDPGTVFVFTNLADGTVAVTLQDAGADMVRVLTAPAGEPYCEAAEMETE